MPTLLAMLCDVIGYLKGTDTWKEMKAKLNVEDQPLLCSWKIGQREEGEPQAETT